MDSLCPWWSFYLEDKKMRTQDEITKDIKFVLEEKVAPSVAAHSGAITFIDFTMDTGVATLKLSGSCSGCAMSKVTLHRGVEDMLKHYVPEVNAIVGKDDEEAADQGYEPYFPKDKEPDWKKLMRE
jgi:Fe-S cluster biogenesis protein NfuA